MTSQIRPVSAVVLAAGEGTRMRSGTPKVLHPLCGRPMLLHVLDALEALPLERIVVVVGHAAEHVTKTLQEQLTGTVPVEFVEQHTQRGTGDAVSVALTAFADDLDLEDDLIVVMGDAPLLRAETLAMLATEHRHADAAATLLTARVPDPTGYGRIVRDAQGRVERIVEQADAEPDELEIDEINPSIYCFRRGFLAPALRRLSPENAQGEYYLTDVVAVLRQAGHVVLGVEADDPTEAVGVNDRAQLAEAEAELRTRINVGWMRAGVGMTDPSRTYLDTTVVLAPDVQLLPGTILQGRTVVGAGSVIGPDTQLVGHGGRGARRRAPDRRPRSRDRRRRQRRSLRVVAARHPPRGGRARRHVRRDQELGDRRGRQGPAPRLRGRRRGRAPAPTSVPARSPPTTTAGASTTRRSASTRAPGRTPCWWRRSRWATGRTPAPASVVTRDVPPGALAKGVPASIEEGWAARREDAPTEHDDGVDGDGEGS